VEFPDGLNPLQFDAKVCWPVLRGSLAAGGDAQPSSVSSRVKCKGLSGPSAHKAVCGLGFAGPQVALQVAR
jgi:hypothetical protein